LNFHSPNPFAADASTVRASERQCLGVHRPLRPATSFNQSTAWDVAPETAKSRRATPASPSLARSTEFAHLTVLRESCRTKPCR
jgi:hypothetical protein